VLYRRAQATARRTGNAVMDAFYVFSIGEIALDRGGDPVAAREALELSLLAAHSRGAEHEVALTEGVLAEHEPEFGLSSP
jgi:hypothetical protein